MKKNKIISIALLNCFLISINLLAQDVDQGKKFLYDHRYESAKSQFRNVLSAHPDNVEAAYWLGQSLIADNDSSAAKELYTKALAANANAPLILAGMGQVELMDNKISEARQRFETGLNITKRKDLEVIHAIARANIDATPVKLDTSAEGKLKIMNDAAAFAKSSGNYDQQARWLEQIYNNTKEPSNRDLYDWGYANYQAKNYQAADSIFCDIYTQKFPTEIFGYLWCAQSAGAQDTTMEKGYAVEPYKKLISFARASGEREDYKATLIQAHGYLASYYANVAKDKDSAVVFLENILKLDPDNASATQYIEALTRNETKNRAAASKAKSPANKKNKKR